MSRFSAAGAESFLYTPFVFFGSEFADFDNIDIHGIRVSSFGGVQEGLVGLVSGFGVPFGDFIGTFPLGLERNGFFIPVIDGSGDSVHGHNVVHEGRRDAGREISNENILVSDACKGGVVLEVRDILDKGWGIGVVLSFGHAFSGEPGDGVTSGVMVFECGLKLCDKCRESPHGYGGSRDGILSECGCPSKGRSFGHVG